MEAIGTALIVVAVMWLGLAIYDALRFTPAKAKPPTQVVAEIELTPDSVLVVSTPDRLTHEEQQELSAMLSAMVSNKRRPLVMVVPTGMKVEAVIRCPPKNSVAEATNPPAPTGSNDGGI